MIDLAEFRRLRLAEVVPDKLFTSPKRRAHFVKDLLMLKPVGPRLLVKPISAPKLTSETIIIPDTANDEASGYALVLAVGTLTENIQVADTIFVSKYAGAPVTVTLDGEKLEAMVISETDVLGVLKED